ncbi:MAG: ArnT family glycosyltransferase, partial [Nitrospinota bacterium]
MSPLGRRTAFLLAFLLVLIFVTRLDRPGLLAPGEGRYAEAARTMVLSGDWVVPRVNGQIHLEKPPLLYWLAAASFTVFGMNETSARLVPALSALLAALMVFLLGRRIYGETGGWLAAFILLTGMTWSVYARFLTTDVPAVAFQAVSLWAYWRARETGARRYLIAFAAALAAGVLTRGLLALSFPIFTIVAFCLIRREWKPRDPGGWLLAAVLFFALAAPWHVAVEMRLPGFLRHYLVENHLGRFVGAYPPRGMSSLSFGGFWLTALGGLLPWSFFLPAAAADTWRRLRRGRALSEGDLYALLWAGSVLVFVSFSGSRMERYFLPAAPGLALWMAGRLVSASGEGRGGRVSWAYPAGAAGIAAAGLALAWVPLWPRAPELIPQGKGILSLLPWIGSFFALGGMFAFWAMRRG